MRDKLLQLLIISVGILIIVKLFSLQVINSSSELINNNASVQKIYEFPERGYIYDRNNKLIVSNDFSYDILVVPADVNLEDSILISKDFNIDTSVFNEKLLDAKNFSSPSESTSLFKICCFSSILKSYGVDLPSIFSKNQVRILLFIICINS